MCKKNKEQTKAGAGGPSPLVLGERVYNNLESNLKIRHKNKKKKRNENSKQVVCVHVNATESLMGCWNFSQVVMILIASCVFRQEIMILMFFCDFSQVMMILMVSCAFSQVMMVLMVSCVFCQMMMMMRIGKLRSR